MERQLRHVGDFEICATAMPSALGGYTAAVSVRRRRHGPPEEVLFSNAVLADGFRFADVKAAMRYAFDVGHRSVRLIAAAA